jgi:hypothetical protein
MNKIKLGLIIRFFKLNHSIKKIDRDNYKEMMKAFKKNYNDISLRTEKEKGIMAFHRMFLIIGLALYKSLYDQFQNQEELIEKIHDILWKERMSKNIRFVAFFIRRSKDPFHRYLQILGPNNEWFFPCPPWEKVSVEIQDGIGWHQKKCPYKDFFEKEGVVELTRAYCDMDKRIAELFPNHIELKRQHRLAKGDDWCDFFYYKKSLP